MPTITPISNFLTRDATRPEQLVHPTLYLVGKSIILLNPITTYRGSLYSPTGLKPLGNLFSFFINWSHTHENIPALAPALHQGLPRPIHLALWSLNDPHHPTTRPCRSPNVATSRQREHPILGPLFLYICPQWVSKCPQTVNIASGRPIRRLIPMESSRWRKSGHWMFRRKHDNPRQGLLFFALASHIVTAYCPERWLCCRLDHVDTLTLVRSNGHSALVGLGMAGARN